MCVHCGGGSLCPREGGLTRSIPTSHFTILRRSLSRCAPVARTENCAQRTVVLPVCGAHAGVWLPISPRNTLNRCDLGSRQPELGSGVPQLCRRDSDPCSPVPELCTPISSLGSAARQPASSDQPTLQALRGNLTPDFGQPCIGFGATMHRTLGCMERGIDEP